MCGEPTLARFCEAPVLVGRRLHDVDATTLPVKLNHAIHQSEQRKVITLPDAFSGMKLIPDLANNDIPGANCFAAIFLDSATLSVRIASVSAGALTLLYVP